MIDKILMENLEPVKKFVGGDKYKRGMSHCHLAGMVYIVFMCHFPFNVFKKFFELAF